MTVPISILELSSLDGTNGFQINGVDLGDNSGRSVASAGDVNGDGFEDLIIGADGADPYGTVTGASYVVFGKADGFASVFELSALDGTDGFRISGELADDRFGYSVASAGDVNGDGFDDVIIGAGYADPNGSKSGASYVVFGKASGFVANLTLSDLDGSNGFQMNGKSTADFSGGSVASAGDINGDGFDDVIVGANYALVSGIRSGASYVVFGKASGFSTDIALSSLDGSNGFQIIGETSNSGTGFSVASAGDVNGDGLDDFLIGAIGAAPNGAASGATYVVFGKVGGYTASLNLSALDGSNGFQINGEVSGDSSGKSVSSAGDVNGDGFDDLIIGAAYADPNGLGSGASYVVFGKAGGFAANLELSSLDGSNGFQINGETANDRSGISVASAGDVNGDGLDDLIIGAFLADPNGLSSGATYVAFGKAGGFTGTLELSTLNGSNGFKINGVAANDGSGRSAASAGDVNGDGFDDLVIGAAGADPNGNLSGASYVVFGKATGSLDRVGTDLADILSGGDWDDRLSGHGGDDHIRAGGGDDEVIGGSGDDRLDGGNDSDTVSGGSGDDRILVSLGEDILRGGSGFDRLDFSNLGTAKVNINLAATSFVLAGTSDRQTISSFENVTGGGGNDKITGSAKANVLDGGLGNDRLSGAAGTDSLTGGGGNDIFVFASKTGTDTITDFENGLDRIDLKGLKTFVDFADLLANHLAKSGADVIIAYGTDHLVLEGVTKALITADDFIF